ncbi:MAG TPA: Crp/Fnr family transcriptional regulator [Pseudomonadales bacterium]|nr:Crp/Fnr family transcriptional regulator [Pseudomonadales bacterium]
MKNLQAVPLFKNLSAEDLEKISQYASSRSFPKNTVIINEGDDTDSLYLIDKGSVKVYLSDNNGKEVIINTLESGEYFGELAILSSGKRSASVMTLENTTLSLINKNNFKNLLLNQPTIAYVLIENLAQRVRELTENIKSLALQDVYGRVVKTLLSLSEPIQLENADKRVIRKRITQQEIASRVGSSREMVARILKDLALGDYITHDNKQIVINKKLPDHY